MELCGDSQKIVLRQAFTMTAVGETCPGGHAHSVIQRRKTECDGGGLRTIYAGVGVRPTNLSWKYRKTDAGGKGKYVVRGGTAQIGKGFQGGDRLERFNNLAANNETRQQGGSRTRRFQA